MIITIERVKNGWVVETPARHFYCEAQAQKHIYEDTEKCSLMETIKQPSAESLVRLIQHIFYDQMRTKHHGGIEIQYNSKSTSQEECEVNDIAGKDDANEQEIGIANTDQIDPYDPYCEEEE